ncbi:MAG: hypothetical protein WA364_19720 [Candidatus Nitrosopolaris sp.]
MNNDLPELDFLSSAFSPSDLLASLTALPLDFFSRIKFATLKETPPRTKPTAVAGRA